MITVGEDALICDLAETYGIYEYRAYSPVYIGTLAAGLRDDSRIKMQMSGEKLSISQLLAAMTVDKLANLVWMQSKDGVKGKNRPESILTRLQGDTQEKKKEIQGFDSPEDFEKAWNSIGGETDVQS